MIIKKTLQFKEIENINDKEITLTFELEDSLSKNIEQIQIFLDKLIMNNNKITISNVPPCLLLGHKRYIKQTGDHKQVKSCEYCKLKEECKGIEINYLEKYGDKEFVPINQNLFITDNQKCMIKILSNNNNISTKEMLSLASKYLICQDCTAGDHVIRAGEKLIQKKIVKKSLTNYGYMWELVK